MDAANGNEADTSGISTAVERSSDRELVVRRTFNGPARLVFEAWSTPELMQRWWAPESLGVKFVSCEMDARTGGSYRFVMSHPAAEKPMAFFGRYLDVTPPSRLVWTNDEDHGAGSITTVTFEDRGGGQTEVVIRDLYPSKEALDEAIASGATAGYAFDQLDALLAELSA